MKAHIHTHISGMEYSIPVWAYYTLIVHSTLIVPFYNRIIVARMFHWWPRRIFHWWSLKRWWMKYQCRIEENEQCRIEGSLYIILEWKDTTSKREVEHATFTPLVLSATGGMANEARHFYKRIASCLATKWDQPYSCTPSWLRCRLTYSLLRSVIQYLRGARSSVGQAW